MKKLNILFFILAVFGFASCSDSSDGIEHNGRTPVNFSSSITLGNKARVVDNNWGVNDAVGIYMFNTGTNTIAEDAVNKKYTAANTGANTNFRADANNLIYFPDNGNAVDFTAYYPYNTSVTDFVYKLDLDEQTDQNALDFMTATKVVGKSKADPNVALEFTHLLSKIILTVTSTEIADLSTLTAVANGMNTKADFDLTTGVFSDETGSTPITALKNGTTFELTLLPMTLTTTQTIDFVINGSIYSWDVSVDIPELKGGNKYIYDVKLSPTFTTVTTTGTIKAWVDNSGNVNVLPKEPVVPSVFQVGDYYPDPALDPSVPADKAKIEGVVFEVSNGGKNGKILSLVESSGLVWGPNAPVNTVDEDNGLSNWNIIKGINPTFDNYPAFKWVNQLGEGWYIPAKNEVVAFRNFWQADRVGINDRITNAGGMAISSIGGTNYYISSTEDTVVTTKIWSVGFATSNNVNTAIKANTGGAATLLFRAVKSF